MIFFKAIPDCQSNHEQYFWMKLLLWTYYEQNPFLKIGTRLYFMNFTDHVLSVYDRNHLCQSKISCRSLCVGLLNYRLKLEQNPLAKVQLHCKSILPCYGPRMKPIRDIFDTPTIFSQLCSEWTWIMIKYEYMVIGCLDIKHENAWVLVSKVLSTFSMIDTWKYIVWCAWNLWVVTLFIHTNVNLSVRFWPQEIYGTWHWDDLNEYTQNIQYLFLEKFG